MWAPMYESTVHRAGPSGFRLGLRGMVAPRIEPEVVLKLRRLPPSCDATPEELAACLGWVALGFEGVDCHYDGWRFTAADAVADFGLHRALIVGTPWPLEWASPREWAEALPSLAVTLRRGEDVVAEGLGRSALGSPLLALAQLARVLAAQAGAPPLAASEIVTTGTLTPPPPIAPCECWQLEAVGGPFPPLRLEVVDDLTSA
jgi:2-oxo-3-hexenedioate decarboxylase